MRTKHTAMISNFLTTTLLLAAALPASAQVVSSSDEPRLQGLMGEDLGPEEDLDTSLGGQFTNPFDASVTLTAVQPNIYKITLNDTGTGWKEQFLLAMPRNTGTPAPLLMVFHGYSRTPDSILEETKYLQKAQRKGWYGIAPMGAHKYSFSIPYAQQNIEAVLEWAIAQLEIDTDRIYGVGFSMGGGMAATFAARHQNPNAPRFAAIVNHTGTVSMRDVYNNSINRGILEHPDMFGGSPDQFPFLYAQSSALDIDVLGDVDMGTDLSRNLLQTPVLSWFVDSDPLAYLALQTEAFHAHLGTRKVDSTLRREALSEHSWSTLRERSVFQFLSKKSLADPAVGTRVQVLADRDNNFYHFDVQQRAADEFTRFDWRALSGLNRLFLESMTNLDGISFHVKDVGLDGDRDLEVIIKSASTDSISIEILGITQAPSDVKRSGVSNSDWSFDAATGVLRLMDLDPSRYRQWTLVH
ncbi:MAG: acetyl esterase/lipase [Chlamydiales bacterium]|jgi:acetyl esterase/lipase